MLTGVVLRGREEKMFNRCCNVERASQDPLLCISLPSLVSCNVHRGSSVAESATHSFSSLLSPHTFLPGSILICVGT